MLDSRTDENEKCAVRESDPGHELGRPQMIMATPIVFSSNEMLADNHGRTSLSLVQLGFRWGSEDDRGFVNCWIQAMQSPGLTIDTSIAIRDRGWR
jgi:hypothetical protein